MVAPVVPEVAIHRTHLLPVRRWFRWAIPGSAHPSNHKNLDDVRSNRSRTSRAWWSVVPVADFYFTLPVQVSRLATMV